MLESPSLCATMADRMNALPPFKDAGLCNLNADQVAWILTQVGYGATDEHVSSYCKVAKAHNFQSNTRQLCSDLTTLGENVLSMEFCENTFGFSWEIDYNLPCNEDPFFSRIIHNEIDASIHAFVHTLDAKCASLAGIDVAQNNNMIMDDLARIKLHAAREISKVMRSRGSTNKDVIEKIRALDEFYTPRSIKDHKEFMRASILGVSSLAKVADASRQGCDLNEVLQTHYASVREVCLNTPRQLQEALKRAKVHLAVLKACFYTSNTAVGASSQPPAWAKLVDIVYEFFCHADTASRVVGACYVAVTDLRKDIACNEDCGMWSGVLLSDLRSAKKRARDDDLELETVKPLDSPHHRGDKTGLAIVSPNPTQEAGALRAVRFLKTLLACAESGFFAPRQAKASILLSSVSRFYTENKFLIDKQSEVELQLLEAHVGRSCPFFLDDDDYDTAPTNTNDTIACATQLNYMERSGTPLADCGEAQSRHAHVSLEFEADFNILNDLLSRIGPRTSVVPLKAIKRGMMSKGGYFESEPARSIEQSITNAIKKIIDLMVAEGHSEGTIKYQKGDKGGIIQLDAIGASSLSKFLKLVLSRMQNSEPNFAKIWYKNKSTRNRASAKATKRRIKS